VTKYQIIKGGNQMPVIIQCEWCKQGGQEDEMIIEGQDLLLPESEWEYYHEDCHDKLREYAREKLGI
jgi:hypothetical protein